MKKQTVYQCPEVETMLVAIEHGFAGSPQVEEVTEGEEI